MLSTERLRLVDVKSNWPVRFFWRLAPVVPAPANFIWALSVPLRSPLRSGWKEFTSGASGMACALSDQSYLKPGTPISRSSVVLTGAPFSASLKGFRTTWPPSILTVACQFVISTSCK